MDTTLLKELGLTKAAGKIEEGQNLKRKLALAYEHYRFVSPDILERFEKQLHKSTIKIQCPCPECHGKGKEELFVTNNNYTIEEMMDMAKKSKLKTEDCGYCGHTGAKDMTYDALSFTKIEEYPMVKQIDKEEEDKNGATNKERNIPL